MLAVLTPSRPSIGSTCRSGNGKGVSVTISHTVRSAASMTPPVLAKMSAAPVEMPSGASIFSSGSARKSMPAWVIIAPSSRVVRTMSTSRTPLAVISGRAASNFFAVQGMTETTTMSSGLTPILSA